MHSTAIPCLGSWVLAEDQQTLLAILVLRHEEVSACLSFNTTQLATAISCDPTLAVLRNVDLGHIVSVGYIPNHHCTLQLRQQPLDKFPAAPPLLECASHEGHMSNILQDAARGLCELLARGAAFAQAVAELVVPEDHAVSRKALLIGDLLTHPFGEGARRLLLHKAHHLELSSTPASRITKDGELLSKALAAALSLLLAHEKHQSAPLLLHCA
mmetsp:Transcript_69159/g.165843  ORF Transcript_69159/g.165843 Transcript_69159/m.165843 type:complete len:214 (-) Transcript_69159:1066-1707(-)